MRRAGVLVCVLTVGAMTAGCGSGDGTTPTGGSSQAGEVDAEAVSVGSLLAQIRGHHLVAVELYGRGDRQGALVHAGHPIHEILASVTPELEGHDVGAELEDSLALVQELILDRAPPEEVEAAVSEAASITEAATRAVAGDGASSSSYRGSVIADILGTATAEYEEAVAGNGRLRLLVEYQDAFAFVQEGARMYSEIEADIRTASQEEADEIDEAFETLEQALPEPQAPAQLASPLDVASAIELIGHELEETVGAELAEEQDPAAIGEEIEALLGEIVATYRAGDAEGAAELAAEAYLENYEVIEAEVIEKAPDVNEELEPLLGAELRKRIQEGAPVDEIEGLVRRAKELLLEALEALGAER